MYGSAWGVGKGKGRGGSGATEGVGRAWRRTRLVERRGWLIVRTMDARRKIEERGGERCAYGGRTGVVSVKVKGDGDKRSGSRGEAVVKQNKGARVMSTGGRLQEQAPDEGCSNEMTREHLTEGARRPVRPTKGTREIRKCPGNRARDAGEDGDGGSMEAIMGRDNEDGLGDARGWWLVLKLEGERAPGKRRPRYLRDRTPDKRCSDPEHLAKGAHGEPERPMKGAQAKKLASAWQKVHATAVTAATTTGGGGGGDGDEDGDEKDKEVELG
ncbi:hypothetical protein BOTBODRAFT_47433 [Botryobasidium botryosum FD-172 SS1]|uniref:Uncharacterized protein n=1 Tax=Botryobasidium botryosum (strain FD-172 SS1) TaxID=930990 RepID=A0A067M2T7_BOTB1|nr:hypothetical protein BOTBODRAFT_47433 [Botryobasidium botryosum FD-172 SS1]